MQNNQNTPKNRTFTTTVEILKQFTILIESIWVHNRASYLHLPDFRARINALVLQWLIFPAACLAGIGVFFCVLVVVMLVSN
jgi:hypothetical protein